jgi:IS1 family transposase
MGERGWSAEQGRGDARTSCQQQALFGSVLICLLAISILASLPFGKLKFKPVLATMYVKAEVVMSRFSKCILKSDHSDEWNDVDLAHVFPQRLATNSNVRPIWITVIGRKGVLEKVTLGTLLEQGDGSFLQREYHPGRVNNLKGNHQSNLAFRGLVTGWVDINILNIEPLTQLDFLQFDGTQGSLGGTTSLPRLPTNESCRQGGNNNQPPVGALEGCVPAWRAIIGCILTCCGFLIIIKGDGTRSIICGCCCILGGTFIWLGKKVDCEAVQQGNETQFHGPNTVTQKYLTTLYYCNTVMGMANVLPKDKQNAVIGALAEGSSIRSIERLTGIHRDTIMRLGVRVGQGCEMLLDSKMQDLGCNYLQLDEVWGFIGKKERHCSVDDNPELGDVWTYCAIDSETKLVPSFKVGKRTLATTTEFVHDVASRMRNRVQISTDALRGYAEAIEQSFGADVDYGQIVKIYTHDGAQHPERKYSAPSFASAMRRPIAGDPERESISTSHVERLNATTRLHVKRLSRLTLAFSKKLDNFKAAVGLHFAYYNLVRRHATLRCTPAMAAGVEKDFWTVGDLVEAVS